MGERLLVAVAAIIPVVALAFEHVGNVRISERHHSHHDTYVVPVEFTRSLVLAMTFMAVLGLLVAWLCERDVFLADAVVVLGFFALVFLYMLVSSRTVYRRGWWRTLFKTLWIFLFFTLMAGLIAAALLLWLFYTYSNGY